MIDWIYWISGALSGVAVGFVLGLIGGGGSILAVPLMVYVVGVPNPHTAIGTSALAVAANALAGLVNHARRGTVKWRCGLFFAVAGVLGALAGSTVGKNFDGQKLLFLFAILMIVVGALMLRKSGRVSNADVVLGRENALQLGGYGLGAGAMSGFFGIGGGFLIVPGLIAATSMPMIYAVGTSLVAVSAFGITTASNYALSGYVDWLLAGVFVVGGVIGSLVGTRMAQKLSSTGALTKIFAGVIFVVAAYMLWQSWMAM
ncbi:sulfite exporter TauE/SafE family protein [Qipengyuania aquimaris]|uniref:Probable membrane transporter protein n=1 Tax=Qipengyuania aquimaris TaxID=255984 RepID=A0A9Q3XCV3_9SPHN|nr:sulfite exporter TauE/SafE family protein [Qipengyuania aquimaris]MBY6218407.1 sulfite exporter TauE/SafE family protein [Qipengyuania aquimaris]